MKQEKDKKPIRPKQQIKSGIGQEEKMRPQPVYEKEKKLYRLEGKNAIITGGDSGIGRAIAIAFAKEGANVVISYYEDDKDARKTEDIIKAYNNGECILCKGDIASPAVCKKIVSTTLKKFGSIDIIINNAAVQNPLPLKDITKKQLERTFAVNIFSQFYMVQAAEPHLKENACIINTASVVAYRGNQQLLDYSATKGAVISFTRSLSAYFSSKKIRVNAVAPGPIWTPLIPSTFEGDDVSKFGSNTPMQRAGEPVEVAYCYVFLACDDSSYISGQVLHPNGGEVVNG